MLTPARPACVAARESKRANAPLSTNLDSNNALQRKMPSMDKRTGGAPLGGNGGGGGDNSSSGWKDSADPSPHPPAHGKGGGGGRFKPGNMLREITPPINQIDGMLGGLGVGGEVVGGRGVAKVRGEIGEDGVEDGRVNWCCGV